MYRRHTQTSHVLLAVCWMLAWFTIICQTSLSRSVDTGFRLKVVGLGPCFRRVLQLVCSACALGTQMVDMVATVA